MELTQERSGGGFLLLMLAGLLACLFAFVFMGDVPTITTYDVPVATTVTQLDTRAGQKVESDGITIEYQAHAESHGVEANWTRDCFGKYGTVMLFKWPFDNRYARLCMDDEGYIGAQFIKWISAKFYVELSSYVPHLRDTSLSGIKEWMLSQDWTFFTGPLP